MPKKFVTKSDRYHIVEAHGGMSGICQYDRVCALKVCHLMNQRTDISKRYIIERLILTPE